MVPSLHVWLVRHGESESNAGLPSDDAASAPLTALGREQAEAVARRFTAPPGRIVVSAYARAVETAAPLRARYPGVPVEEWPVHEFTYLGPDDYRGTTVEERQPAAESYWETADPHEVRGQGAESFAAFLARVHEARERLEHLAGADGGSLVLFSHKKFLNALRWSFLAGVPRVSSRRMKRYRGFDLAMPFPNGGVVELRLEAGGAWLGSVREALPVEAGA